MWNYEKRLQYPVNIKTPNAKIAQVIMSQYGGPDGEMGLPCAISPSVLPLPTGPPCGAHGCRHGRTGHLEIVATIVHQLTRNLTPEEIEKSGFAPYYTDHTVGIWPQAAGGIPFNACEFSPPVIPSPTSLRIWPPNRRPGKPMTTSSGW